ncbi:MAG: histidine kinase [Candidatus Marinimicrobia bacterium CG08_land_8_20_14_0_20_45_22]|nr:MAG: histidine kinase [Candidatus Marinimicrobia bacterium CG08_land_8_20_14_0_20_45_22]
MVFRLLLSVVLLASVGFAAKPCRVTFVVESSGLSGSASVFITGNQKLLGNWNPAKVRLQLLGNHRFGKTFTFPSGTFVKYKFMKGGWGQEAADENGGAFQNFLIDVRRDTTLVHPIRYWLDGKDRPVSGQITGRVEYFRSVAGKGINLRNIVVWLPPDYESDSTRRYAVLYMHDGQNIIDPRTSSFGVDWQADEIADSLIRSGKIAPFIFVGIYNTADRTAEYSPTRKGSAYSDFIIRTVKPMIDKKYRTLPDREHPTVAGSSMGGLISFMLVWEHPEVFSQAICMSPAFKIDQIDYVKNVQKYSGKKKPIRIYIDNGGVGLETRLQPGIDDMLTALSEKGYIQDRDYFWVKDLTAEHNESAWAKRLPNALIRVFAQ